MQVLINVVVGYVAWAAVAFLAARGHPMLAILPSLAAVALYLATTGAAARGREFGFVLLAVPIGLAVESILLHTGITRYADGTAWGGLPPAFMIGLWMAFATLINVSLAWLKSRLGLAVVLGAVAAAPSYYAGARIGALTLAEPVALSLAAIGLLWAVALPLLLLAARRWTADQPLSWKKS